MLWNTSFFTVYSYSHFTYTCSQRRHTYRMKPKTTNTIIVTNLGAKAIDDENMSVREIDTKYEEKDYNNEETAL